VHTSGATLKPASQLGIGQQVSEMKAKANQLVYAGGMKQSSRRDSLAARGIVHDPAGGGNEIWMVKRWLADEQKG